MYFPAWPADWFDTVSEQNHCSGCGIELSLSHATRGNPIGLENMARVKTPPLYIGKT
jgi:hypothetical protein